MAQRDMASARKKRALEAKRDMLIERKDRTNTELAQVRAALKTMRGRKAR